MVAPVASGVLVRSFVNPSRCPCFRIQPEGGYIPVFPLARALIARCGVPIHGRAPLQDSPLEQGSILPLDLEPDLVFHRRWEVALPQVVQLPTPVAPPCTVGILQHGRRPSLVLEYVLPRTYHSIGWPNAQE